MKPFSIAQLGLTAAMVVAAQAACSSEQNGNGGSGGKPGSGGIVDSGGSPASGGAAGGSVASGGTAGVTAATGGNAAGAGGLSGSGGVTGKNGGAGAAGTAMGGSAGAGRDASPGGTTGGGGARTGGSSGTGGNTGNGGAAGATGPTPDGGGGPVSLVDCPDLPGATASPLYSVTVTGKPLFVEKLAKFSPEMQVHYASGSLSGSGAAAVAVTVSESFSSYKISPKSKQISATKSGNTITFNTGPNYLILQFDSKELLFILLDAEETAAPKIGDANVKNLADYGVDNTGASLVTSKIQSAITAASGATQNILYVPPGKYKVGELWLKSNMTMYLACGAILYGSSSTSDFNTGSGGINIEGMQHSLIRMYQVTNTKLLGRGVLDANGLAIRAAGLNASLLKIDQSSNITVDGILVRDSSYWNTLSYRSDQVTIQNYKVINCRPSSGYNNTDGVDFCDSTNCTLSNAFLYTGDDSIAPKNEDTNNTKNLVHQHVVVYSNSVGCKIGTNSQGQSMDSIAFKDIDVVKAGRAMTIEAYDTAVVSNATFEDVRVEAADTLINLALDSPPTWRTAADTGVYKDTYFTNVSSDVKKVISLHGKSSSVNITGVHFKNLTVQGKAITSQTDSNASWDINSYVSGITFE